MTNCNKCGAYIYNNSCIMCSGSGRRYSVNQSYSSMCGSCCGIGKSYKSQCDKCTSEGIVNFFSMIYNWIWGSNKEKTNN